MRDYRLSKEELADLRAAHRATRELREAYRINAVILLGRGHTVAAVADALLIDPDTVREYYKRYRKGGSKYPPAKPGALVCEPLEAANRGR